MSVHVAPIVSPGAYFDAILPLVDAKKQLRVTSTSEDTLITRFRNAAIGAVQRDTNLRLGPTVGIVVTYDDFDDAGLQLPLGPIATAVVTGVGYVDGSGVGQAVGSWRVTAGGRVVPAIGAAWPTGSNVTVTYDAGFPADALPEEAVTAVLLLTAHFYHNREAAGPVEMLPAPLAFNMMCDQLREYR